MKSALVHTDFRIYWPARLNALTSCLATNGISLSIIEVAGKGSPYGFAFDRESYPENWHCLFPYEMMENIRPSKAKAAVIRKLDEISPDIVISGAVAYPSGAASVYWAVKNYKKIIVFDDARLQDIIRPYFVDMIKLKVYNCVDAVFCPSPGWIKTFEHFGMREDQLFFGVDVVDNDFWKKPNHSETKPPVNSKFFLAVGRLVHKKNFFLLLKAYKQYIRHAHRPLHLVIVGEGIEGQGLKSFTQQFQHEGMVHFFPFMQQEDLKSFFHNASWFVLPSKFGETWGLVINEAMASGLPVLVSNQAGCASTLVRNGINGFTFSPDNEFELAEMLIRAGSLDEAKRKEMGERSLDIISGWGIDRFCRGLLSAIDYTLENEKRRSSMLSRIIVKFWNGRYRPL